ncbi:MAG: MBL fold metallo-hydrolase [Lachnospiraceae bacterium]|nr:MBL fold metallo-hydrolase [Lachnospiraceae bacterium]
MLDLKVTDVRILPGDSGFLLDDGQTSILFDTSFAFTGYQMADKVKELLGERKLDYIFLSHSHYDHVLGAPYVLKAYPEAKVVAGEYAAKIFAKPTARATMRDLDRKYATTCGVFEYEDLIDELKVDITVNDGDTIRCGDMTFTVVSLPGHTKDSIAFYLREKKLLLGSETLGVYFGEDTYLPFFLVGYQMSLDSFEKVKSMDIDYMLLPHYGVVDKEETKRFLKNSEWTFRDTAEKIVALYRAGGTVDDALAYYKDRFYKKNVKPTYPINAFNLNTSIMIELIKKELL